MTTGVLRWASGECQLASWALWSGRIHDPVHSFRICSAFVPFPRSDLRKSPEFLWWSFIGNKGVVCHLQLLGEALSFCSDEPRTYVCVCIYIYISTSSLACLELCCFFTKRRTALYPLCAMKKESGVLPGQILTEWHQIHVNDCWQRATSRRPDYHHVGLRMGRLRGLLQPQHPIAY